jgi:cell division septation protein DedD
VQVGAFTDRNNAADLLEHLQDAGFRNIFVLTLGQGRDRIHRVRIGPLRSAGEYDRIRSDLRAAGVYDSSLVRDN